MGRADGADELQRHLSPHNLVSLCLQVVLGTVALRLMDRSQRATVRSICSAYPRVALKGRRRSQHCLKSEFFSARRPRRHAISREIFLNFAVSAKIPYSETTNFENPHFL